LFHHSIPFNGIIYTVTGVTAGKACSRRATAAVQTEAQEAEKGTKEQQKNEPEMQPDILYTVHQVK
jgi:F0F1-type ATP synthase assembly protein I